MHRVSWFAPLLVLLAAVALPQTARAQTDFVPYQSWFTGPGGVLGVRYSLPNDAIEIDTDGDGVFEAGEGSYPPPPAYTQTVANSGLRLSPSREHVLLFGTAVNGPCSGQEAWYVYRVPANNGDPLELAGPPICVDSLSAFVGFFDPGPGDTNDTFFLVENSNPTTLEQDVTFKRLIDGTTSTGFPFDRTVGAVTFSPTGIAAFVQYDTSDGDNLDDYQMVELCADDFGQYVGVASGSVSQVTGGGVATARQLNATDVEVIRASDQQSIAFYTLDDCSGPLPDTGACCLSDGSCASGTTEAGCIGAGGTWQGANTDCAGVNCPPPPEVSLSVSASGPGVFQAPGVLTYTLSWSNDGDLDAGGTQVFATIPSFTSFDGATDGGVYDSLNRRVTWTVGTAAAGASGSVQFSVSVACGVSQIRLDQYSIQSTAPVDVDFGSGSVTTTITTPGGGPMTVSATSVSDTGNPPGDGDTITHTVTLTETSGVARQNLRMNFRVGSVWDYDGLLSDGGGAVTLNNQFLEWIVDVPANASVSLQFRTRVPDCRNGFQLTDALNSGSSLSVFDECNSFLGQATPPLLDLAPLPVAGGLALTGSGIGPVGPGVFSGQIALARKGSTAEIAASIDNTTAVDVPNGTLSITVPDGLLPVGHPPWVGTPPTGATWDAVTETATWSGVVPANGSVAMTIAVTWPTDGPCEAFFRAEYGYGNCQSAGSESVSLYAVPEPGPDPYVLSSANFGGLWSFTPGVDTAQQEFFCEFFEILGNISAGVNGDVWVTGTPTFRLNPFTLEFEDFSAFVANDLDMILASDIAVDPNTGVVYFGGRRRETGSPFRFGRVASWDPATDQITILLDDDASRVHGQIDHIDVLPDGRVVCSSDAGVVIIDPTQGLNTETIWTDPTWPVGVRAGAVAARPDGTVLSADNTFSFTDPKAIRVVDPDTGAFTPFVANMLDVAPSLRMEGLDVSDTGDAWLAYGLVARITPDPNPSAVDVALGGIGSKIDVAWFPGSGGATSVDDVADVSTPRAFALRAPVPNPFNPRTTFAFDLPREADVEVAMYDARGRRVKTLASGLRTAGTHRVVWDGTDDQGRSVSSGVYFVRMEGGGQRFVRKAVLLR